MIRKIKLRSNKVKHKSFSKLYLHKKRFFLTIEMLYRKLPVLSSDQLWKVLGNIKEVKSITSKMKHLDIK